MSFSKKGIIAPAIIVAVILAFLLSLPSLIRYLAVKKIDETTGRKSQIASMTVNPFTLTARVTGVRLSERGSSATFLSFSSAELSISPKSLPKRALIVNEFRIASPYLHVVRDAANHYNFSDLVTPQKEEEKKKGPPLFSLNNIIIKNGSIDFDDKALSAERYHHARDIALSIPFISNIPYLADKYVTPHFQAVINGSPFRLDGRLRPLSRAVESTVQLNVKHIDLPFYLGYLPVPPPVKIASGKLSTAMELGYRVDEKKGPEFRAAGNLGLEGLAVKEPDGAPLASMDKLQLKIANAFLKSKSADISSLEIEGVDLTATRDRSGIWNFQKLFSGTSGTAKGKKEVKAAPKGDAGAGQHPLNLRLARLTLKDGKVHITDHVPKAGFRTDINGLEMAMQNLTLAKGAMAPLELKFATARRETADLKGAVGANPPQFHGELHLAGIPLKDYYPYLTDTLTAPVSGTIAFSSLISYNDQDGVVLSKSELKGERINAPFGQGEGVQLREVVASGIGVDMKRKVAAVQRVDLKGGNVALSKYKDGGYSYQRLLKTKQKAQETRLKKHGSRGESGRPFSYRIERIAGSNVAIRFTDRSNEENPQFKLNGLRFMLSGITGPKQGPIPFTLASGYGGKGRIRADGRLTLEPMQFRGNVELHGIPLRDFDPYIPEDTTVFIAEGALDTKLALAVEKSASGFRGSYAGSLGVRSFYCQDTNLDEDLLKWESLQMDRLKGTIDPFTLAISEVSLSNFYSRIIVQPDGTLNLQHLREESAPPTPTPGAPASGKGGVPTAAPAPPRPAAAKRGASTVQSAAPASKVKRKDQIEVEQKITTVTPAAGQGPAPQPHPIRIDAITLQGGTLNFSDRHLQKPFDTTFYNLGGRVSGLSSEASKLADVDLRGNLENHSPLSIKGVINPLRGDLYLDMKISFSDIELSPLTPYSDTYLGYMIDKGKLSLDLVYHIDKKALSSQNKVFIDQITFGQAVKSPKATKLPVRLAVALLKDRKGEIHLDLPVAGRTDDPKFSVWKVVWQILKNMLVKAATSPMALLGSMFGGGEDFSAVYFAPGSSQLSKNEQDKLAKLTKALHDRPSLNVEMSGYVNKETDPEGYRNEMLLKKMKGEKFRKMVKEGKSPEGLTQEGLEIQPQEYSTYLKAVYQKEKFPKPRNFLGMAKDLPDEEMKKLIITHTVVGNNELQALARERTETVKAYLMKEGIPPERLFEKSADIYKPAAKGGASGRVEFGANVK